MASETGPLEGHPRQEAIEAKMRALDGTPNDEIGRPYNVPEELIRAHRLHLFPPPAPPAPRPEFEQQLAAMEDAPFAAVPEVGDDEEFGYVSLIIGRVGASGRWVGAGDLLTAAEGATGVPHGNAVRLPWRRGVLALLRAAMTRASALEQLVVSGDASLLQ